MIRLPIESLDALVHPEPKDLLRFATVGSVDDGKSTLIGRLLHDTQSIYDDHLQVLRADSARQGTGLAIDFALLTDGLKAEREQGITIDVAYRYFSTPGRAFIIADTPGHEQYTRNMVTGASTANLAIILIDAQRGVLTQTKRHSFIASLLGIPRLLIAVNKMDLVEYSQTVFDGIVTAYKAFATRLAVTELTFIPISALCGDNVVEPAGATMPWYRGQTILQYLEGVYVGSDRNLIDFRLPIQYVLRPRGDVRLLAGQIASGIVRVGDDVLALPSMQASRITSILTSQGDDTQACAPMSVAVALEHAIDVSRGDMLVHPRNRPRCLSRFEATMVWLVEEPMQLDVPYFVKHTTRTTRASVVRVQYRVDVNSLSRMPSAPLGLNEIGRVTLQATTDLFVDPYATNRCTGSFIVIEPASNRTVGAGMVLDRLPAPEPDRERVVAVAQATEPLDREKSQVLRPDRERALDQRAVTIWFTGLSGAGKSSVAKGLGRRLHEAGRHVYLLEGDQLRDGLTRDLAFSAADRAENVRRAAEVARLFNDAGLVILVALISPFRADREQAGRIVGRDRFFEIYVSTPLDVCEARDPKGLYRKARTGEIDGFTGISSPYEPPESPFLTMDTTGRAVDECVEALFARVEPLCRL